MALCHSKGTKAPRNPRLIESEAERRSIVEIEPLSVSLPILDIQRFTAGWLDRSIEKKRLSLLSMMLPRPNCAYIFTIGSTQIIREISAVLGAKLMRDPSTHSGDP
jgi:hypothetical protein